MVEFLLQLLYFYLPEFEFDEYLDFLFTEFCDLFLGDDAPSSPLLRVNILILLNESLFLKLLLFES